MPTIQARRRASYAPAGGTRHRVHRNPRLRFQLPEVPGLLQLTFGMSKRPLITCGINLPRQAAH